MLALAGCYGDPCATTICQNGGAAGAHRTNCSCTCASGYEGQRCETRSIDKFAGNYNSTVTCLGGPIANSTFTITVSPSFPDRINFGLEYFNNSCPNNSGDKTDCYATISDLTVTIPTQSIDIHGISYTISGAGTITWTTFSTKIDFTLNYSPLDACYGGSCTITLSKP